MWGLPLQSCCNLIYKPIYTTLHMYFRLLAAIFDLLVTTTSESIHTSLTVLLDPDIVGVAAVILLLSHIQAEIYDIAYVLPVYGRHL